MLLLKSEKLGKERVRPYFLFGNSILLLATIIITHQPAIIIITITIVITTNNSMDFLVLMINDVMNSHGTSFN